MADYIVAVATEESQRGKGYMREVLTRALRDMNLEGRPFTFLMPAAEAIYRPFDFRFIWKRQKLQLVSDAREKLEQIPVSESREDCEAAGAYMEQWLSKRSQVYTCRDEAYVRRMKKELESEKRELYFLRDSSGEIQGLQAYAEDQEKKHVLLYAEEKWHVREEENQGIMGRITSVREFLPVFSLKESGVLTLRLEIEDKLIPENEGSFLWSLDENGSSLSMGGGQEELQAAQRLWTLKADIGDLTAWLFGCEEAETLWPDMPEEMRTDLDKIQKIQGIWLDEIV